jgi:2-hydroxy-6-oxonona-2,4-dienedioate hydrolase
VNSSALKARRGAARYTFFALAAAVCAVAVLWFTYSRDIAQLRARAGQGSEVVQTSFGTTEYADVGASKPVLVIHGSGGGFDQSLELAGQLAEYGCRLIAPSRFGYLRSSLPANASPETQADAFASLLDLLSLDSVAVFGGSAGAPPRSSLRSAILTAARP